MKTEPMCPVEHCTRRRGIQREKRWGGKCLIRLRKHCSLHEKRHQRTGSPLGVRCAWCTKPLDSFDEGLRRNYHPKCYEAYTSLFPSWEREMDKREHRHRREVLRRRLTPRQLRLRKIENARLRAVARIARNASRPKDTRKHQKKTVSQRSG